MPQGNNEAITTSNDGQNVDESPSKLLELISIESFLQTQDEENHANGKDDKASKIVVLKQDAMEETISSE